MTAQSKPRRASSQTMRVNDDTRNVVDVLAKQLGISLQTVVAQAVEAYRRQLIIEDANAAYARLRADSAAAALFDQEHALFETALGDGLADDRYPV
jgi:predicted transcriptional regulator